MKRYIESVTYPVQIPLGFVTLRFSILLWRPRRANRR